MPFKELPNGRHVSVAVQPAENECRASGWTLVWELRTYHYIVAGKDFGRSVCGSFQKWTREVEANDPKPYFKQDSCCARCLEILKNNQWQIPARLQTWAQIPGAKPKTRVGFVGPVGWRAQIQQEYNERTQSGGGDLYGWLQERLRVPKWSLPALNGLLSMPWGIADARYDWQVSESPDAKKVKAVRVDVTNQPAPPSTG